MMAEKFLSETLDSVSAMGLLNKEIPDYLTNNLNPAFEPRPYQEEAFARFFHCLENPFPGKEKPLHFLFNMATGSGKTLIMAGLILYLYCELMPYNQAFMDKIKAAQSPEALLALWRNIAENSFLNWYINAKTPEDAVKAFVEIGQGENGLEKQKKLLTELLDKNQLYVNLSEMEDEDSGVSGTNKALNRAFSDE